MRDAEVYQLSFRTLRSMRVFRDALRAERGVVGPHFSVDPDTARLHLREYMGLCEHYVVMCEHLAEAQRNVFGAIMVKYPGSGLNWTFPVKVQDDQRHVEAIRRIHERIDFDDYERLVNAKWHWHAARIELMMRSELSLNGIIAFKMTM